MKFVFIERKVNISDDFRTYAEKKLKKLDRYFKSDAVATITVGQQRGRDWLEVTVTNGGLFFRGADKSGDLYQAIDAVETTIDRQVRKNKTRLERRLRDGAFDKENERAAQTTVEEEGEFEIVRTKHFPVKPMAADEAILQMNLLGHTFFVFKDMDNSDAYSVVYRRGDGGYGMIVSS
ncbi:MAG: ribosome-associated translation inhibitor RaiA, partial [Clostridia bacterium]